MNIDRSVRPNERRASCVLVLLLTSLAFASNAAAQGASSGINGRVTDSTGGALPGVTVTITSPALQVPTMATTTEADGTYRFIQLPAGTYEAKYELQGFKATVRQGIVLAVGFIATISPALEIGGVEETITVSGASPVVDTTNNTITSRLSAAEMASIPTSRRPNDIAMMTPGMMISTMPTSTSIGLNGLNNNVSSGGISNYRISNEGVVGSSSGPRNSDMGNVAEVNVTQSGGTADIAQAGIYVNIISKSGGNDFHGRYAAFFTGSALQGNNIDANLNRQGITTAAQSTSYYTDLSGDLGGRLVRDKLWFYGSARDRRNKIGVLGAVNGPHDPNPTAPYLPTAWTEVINGKLSYQMTSKYQLVGFVDQEWNFDQGARLTRFVPKESSAILHYHPGAYKGEFKGTFTNRLLVAGSFAADISFPTYFPQAGFENLPNTLDLATQQVTGRTYPQDHRARYRWQQRADMTYLPAGSLFGMIGGSHELKVGFFGWRGSIDTAFFDDPIGNYILIFNTVGGVPHQPAQLRTYNSPINPHSLVENQSAYVSDRITTGRLTLNLGFRFERYHAWVPPQTKPAAAVVLNAYSGALDVPYTDAGTWNMPAPRAGFAYNLTKDGKTVIKGTYGWFND